MTAQCRVAEQEVGSRYRLTRAGKAPHGRLAPLRLSPDAGPHVRSVSRGRAAALVWLPAEKVGKLTPVVGLSSNWKLSQFPEP